MATKAKSDIEILVPENEVVFGNNKITIKPFPFYQFPKVTKLIASLGVDFINAVQTIKSNDETGEIVFSKESFEAFAVVFENGFTDLVELVSCFTDKTAEWLLDPKNELDHENALLLIAKIVERNKRFFTKTLKSVFPTEAKE